QRIDDGRFGCRSYLHVERAEIDIDQSIRFVVVNLRSLDGHALGWRKAAHGSTRGRDSIWRYRSTGSDLRLDRLGWLYLLLAALLEKFQQGICGLSLRRGEKHRSCQSYRGCAADTSSAH